MDSLIEAIRSSGWADRTIRGRISMLLKLKKDINPNGDSIAFLKDFKTVSKYLLDQTANPGTRKTKILTIKSILKLVDDKAAAKYDNLIHTLVESNDEYKGNNIVKNKEKWISYEDMVEIPYIIEENIKFIYDKVFLSMDEIDQLKNYTSKLKYLRNLTDFIVAMLYCWQPPVRADWCTVLLKPSKTENWYDPIKGIIYWNSFKNVKSFGKQVFTLDNNLKAYLNEYINILNYIHENPKYLLYIVAASSIKVFSRETFSTYFIRMMKTYTKKSISINDLRHIYENHLINQPNYNKLTINEKKQIHNRLLHSYKTAQEYLKVDE